MSLVCSSFLRDGKLDLLNNKGLFSYLTLCFQIRIGQIEVKKNARSYFLSPLFLNKWTKSAKCPKHVFTKFLPPVSVHTLKLSGFPYVSQGRSGSGLMWYRTSNTSLSPPIKQRYIFMAIRRPTVQGFAWLRCLSHNNVLIYADDLPSWPFCVA